MPYRKHPLKFVARFPRTDVGCMPLLSVSLFSSLLRPQVLEDVIEYEETPDGVVKKNLDQILLNGNNVCLLVPGSNGPEEETRT